MEEDIKYLENMIKEYKRFGDLDNLDYEDTERTYKALENLIARYKELEKENKKITDEYMIQKHLINADFLQDYIPKSKIKEKIEEYTSILKTLNKKIDIDRIKAINERILAFKELLDE